MKKAAIAFLLFFFIIQISNSQWEKITVYGTGNGGGTYGFASIGSNLFVTSYISSTGGGVYKSVNSGINWSIVNNGLTNIKIRCLESSGSYLYAGADYMNSSNNGGVFVSVNNGNSWTESNTGLTPSDKSIISLKATGNIVFASCLAYRVYQSNDNGGTWTNFNQGLPTYNVGNSFTIFNNNVFMCEGSTLSGRIYRRSVNGGANWVSLNTNGAGSDNEVRQIYTVNNTLFAATNSGVYKSLDNGQSWNVILPNVLARAITGYGNNLICCLFSGGFRYSSDLGVTWTTLNEGLTSDPVFVSLYVHNGYVFAGTPRAEIYRRAIGTIGITNIGTTIPEKFVLHQNYPNPFNPSTNIEFSLPKSGNVKLTIFDALGKEVAVIVNDNLKAGIYKADWHASAFPSGIYFYKLVAKDFVQTKKMILIK